MSSLIAGLPLMCPHCGERFNTLGLIPTHDWPRPCRRVCPGSGQIPRDAESDRRPLWKDVGPDDNEGIEVPWDSGAGGITLV